MGIRLFFGAYVDCLLFSGSDVALDARQFSIDLDDPNLTEVVRSAEGPALLEGIEIADLKFEQWLRILRQSFRHGWKGGSLQRDNGDD